MSTLIVEVCEVGEVRAHPNADRLGLAMVKGWQTCIRKVDGEYEFKPGDKCVYFPPDSILPPELANGPDDDPPGRLNVMKYLSPLRKDADGNRPPGGRVRAARLRGEVSYGMIIPIQPEKGDDPNWTVGTDVKEHFGVLKWEAPVETTEGDAEPEHSRFHPYTEMEHFGNYAHVLETGEEIVLTEKIHGKNCRLGLILDTDEAGNEVWTWMAGSHRVRRKEFTTESKRFEKAELEAAGISITLDIGFRFKDLDGQHWQIEEVREPREDGQVFFKALKVDGEGEPMLKQSEFWECLTDPVRSLMEHIRDELDWPLKKFSVVMFGEVFGSGVQNMAYGLTRTREFRPFDIAVNGQYLDVDVQLALFEKFGITPVPFVYRGPFSAEVLQEHTSGPTTLCETSEAGKFSGREGVVLKPIRERKHDDLIPTGSNGRVILKSVSADYLEFQGKSGN